MRYIPSLCEWNLYALTKCKQVAWSLLEYSSVCSFSPFPWMRYKWLPRFSIFGETDFRYFLLNSGAFPRKLETFVLYPLILEWNFYSLKMHSRLQEVFCNILPHVPSPPIYGWDRGRNAMPGNSNVLPFPMNIFLGYSCRINLMSHIIAQSK